MPSPDPPPFAFRPLHAGPLVRVLEYRCRACRGGPGPEEESGQTDIVLLRRGAFCRHFGRERAIADVNQVAFFNRGSTYRVSHPTDCGDHGTVLVPGPRVLHELVRECDPAVEDRPELPFPFALGPCDPSAFRRHLALVRRLTRGEADPEWVEETALGLAGDLVAAAFARHGRPRPARPRTTAEHADLAEAAQAVLAGRVGERFTLDDLARALDSSPFHLCRVFRRHTGLTVHRYRTRLRLRAAYDRLSDGGTDLTALALELGFASHSHFTDAFRREFGVPPSAVRGR